MLRPAAALFGDTAAPSASAEQRLPARRSQPRFPARLSAGQLNTPERPRSKRNGAAERCCPAPRTRQAKKEASSSTSTTSSPILHTLETGMK